MSIVVIDDLVPKSLQQEINQIMFGTSFAWYYNSDVTYSTTNKGNPAAFHLLKSDNVVNSPFYNYFSSIAHLGSSAVNYMHNDIVNARCFLQYPLCDDFVSVKTDPLHVDNTFDHLVVLYYVNDSDGDTIIVDKKYKQGETVDLSVDDHHVLERVTPKKGRCVIFNGKYYHTATQPRKNMRCVINFNIV